MCLYKQLATEWKSESGAAAHQHVHVEHPAVFSGADAEALQIHTVFVVEDFVEGVTQLRPQLLASSAFKLWGCIGRARGRTRKEDEKPVRWENVILKNFFLL